MAISAISWQKRGLLYWIHGGCGIFKWDRQTCFGKYSSSKSLIVVFKWGCGGFPAWAGCGERYSLSFVVRGRLAREECQDFQQ